MPRSLPSVHFTDAQDVELSEYRALPGIVVAALLLGLLSPLALVDPWLWCIPWAGVIVGLWAFRRVQRNASSMTGAKRALFGLTLALLFLVAAPTDMIATRHLINRQAQEVVDAWFRAVLENRMLDAQRMMLVVKKEAPAEPEFDVKRAAATKKASKQDEAQKEADEFQKSPLMKSLAAMGPGARVRFYQTHSQLRDAGNDLVQLVYAVTFDEGGERKSYFVCVDARRMRLSNRDFNWRIFNAVGGFRPTGW